MFRIDSKGEISPSSTLDLLPTSTASHVTRRRASSAHHTLEIRPNDGTVVAYGASALEEEGDNFAHLGIGDEWGQRRTTQAGTRNNPMHRGCRWRPAFTLPLRRQASSSQSAVDGKEC